jgi:hypothetical protein
MKLPGHIKLSGYSGDDFDELCRRYCQRDKLEGRLTIVCIPLLDEKRHCCFGHLHRHFGMSDHGRQ